MATYLQIADLKDNIDFRRRIAVCVIRYAAYVLGNTGDQVFREQKVNWARRALVATDEQVYRLIGFVIANPDVQDQLNTIADTALQAIVEHAVNQNMAVLN